MCIDLGKTNKRTKKETKTKLVSGVSGENGDNSKMKINLPIPGLFISTIKM